MVTESLEVLRPRSVGIDDELVDRARALDKHDLLTRYPNLFASGAPSDFYTQSEAERAIADATAVLEICRGILNDPRRHCVSLA